MNKQKLWEAGFVVLGGRGDPGSCEKLRLATLSNFEGWQGTETYYSGMSGNCIFGPIDREHCLGRRHYTQEKSGE